MLDLLHPISFYSQSHLGTEFIWPEWVWPLQAQDNLGIHNPLNKRIVFLDSGLLVFLHLPLWPWSCGILRQWTYRLKRERQTKLAWWGTGLLQHEMQTLEIGSTLVLLKPQRYFFYEGTEGEGIWELRDLILCK